MSTYDYINTIPMRTGSIYSRHLAMYQRNDVVYVTGSVYDSSTRTTKLSSNKKGTIIDVNKSWDEEFGIYGVHFDDGTTGSYIHESAISRYDSVFSIGDNVIDIVSQKNAKIIDSQLKNNKYYHVIKFNDGTTKINIPSENLKLQTAVIKTSAKVGDSVTFNIYHNTSYNLIKKIDGRIISTTNTHYRIVTDEFTRDIALADLSNTDEYSHGFKATIDNGDVVFVTGTINQIHPTNCLITVYEKKGQMIDNSSNFVVFDDESRAMNITSNLVHLYTNGEILSVFLKMTPVSVPRSTHVSTPRSTPDSVPRSTPVSVPRSTPVSVPSRVPSIRTSVSCADTEYESDSDSDDDSDNDDNADDGNSTSNSKTIDNLLHTILKENNQDIRQQMVKVLRDYLNNTSIT